MQYIKIFSLPNLFVSLEVKKPRKMGIKLEDAKIIPAAEVETPLDLDSGTIMDEGAIKCIIENVVCRVRTKARVLVFLILFNN